MPIRITVKIVDDGKFTPGIKSLKNGLNGPEKRRVLRAIGSRFRDITLSTFGAGGTNRPTPWPPLTRRYQKRINYFGPPKLVLRGDLRASIYVRADNDQYVEVGTNIPYSAVHQFGGGNNIPPRPYFPILFQGTNYRLTPFAQQQLEDAARLEITRMTRT